MMIFRERFDFLDLFLFSKNQEKSVLLFSNCSQILISCSSLYNPVLKLFLPHIILFFLTLLDPFLRTIYLYWFLSAMGLPVTSKDLNLSSFLLYWDKITPKSWQKHQFLVNFYLVIPPKKISKKIFIRNSQKIQKISQKISKISKISNYLHRTWRPKTLSGLFSQKGGLISCSRPVTLQL